MGRGGGKRGRAERDRSSWRGDRFTWGKAMAGGEAHREKDLGCEEKDGFRWGEEEGRIYLGGGTRG